MIKKIVFNIAIVFLVVFVLDFAIGRTLQHFYFKEKSSAVADNLTFFEDYSAAASSVASGLSSFSSSGVLTTGASTTSVVSSVMRIRVNG